MRRILKVSARMHLLLQVVNRDKARGFRSASNKAETGFRFPLNSITCDRA